MGTRYEGGDVVATPDGRGVVVAVLTGSFEFPDGGDGTIDVEGSDDSPAHVVGLETGGSAVYRASALAATTLEEEDDDSTDGDRVAGILDEDVDGLDDLPEGWDRASVLSFWSSVGGTWEAAVEDLSDELGEERAERFAAAVKDELLRTERWRNRF
jgi:hypothetical protein